MLFFNWLKRQTAQSREKSEGTSVSEQDREVIGLKPGVGDFRDSLKRGCYQEAG